MKNTKLAAVLVFAAFALAAAAPAASAAQASSPVATTGQDVSAEYKIGPKDLLEISVLGVPEISKLVVRVSEDGRITLPLLGEVGVGDLTKFEVEKKLTQLAGEKIVLKPQVTVHILEYLSRRVSVVGAVGRPGPYELLGRQTVLSVVSAAGGLTEVLGA